MNNMVVRSAGSALCPTRAQSIPFPARSAVSAIALPGCSSGSSEYKGIPDSSSSLAPCSASCSRPSLRAQRASTVTRAAQTSTAAPTVKAVPPQPPYCVVITGSTKGVGRALAEEFLRAGDRVLICSRSAERVDEVVQELAAQYGAERVKGLAVDVSRPGQARQLADFAAEQLGRVDIWINNAGTNNYRYGPMSESTDEELQQIVGTNVLGVMLGCKEAIRVMRAQPSHGHVFNMDGAGAGGDATPRFAAYGATKRSLAQLGKSLGKELEIMGVRNVAVHNLSPGMVTTELLMAGANTPVAKFFINCLAEPATDVASYLVPRIRATAAAPAVNPLSGALTPTYIKFLTQDKAFSKIAARVFAGARKGRYVPE